MSFGKFFETGFNSTSHSWDFMDLIWELPQMDVKYSCLQRE